MRRVLMIMYMTLDGVAEFPQYGGTPDDESDDLMWTPRMKNIDTLILGATSYQRWHAFWPSRRDSPFASTWEKDFSLFADRAQKIAFSKSLQRADWPDTRICRGDPREEVARLKSQPGKDIALGGGPRLAQSFLEHELIDDMFLTIFPSIVGSGKPMFRLNPNPDNPEDEVKPGAPGRHDFRPVVARPMKDGRIFVHYERMDQPTEVNPMFRGS